MVLPVGNQAVTALIGFLPEPNQPLPLLQHQVTKLPKGNFQIDSETVIINGSDR
jgi:hypothetical protein